MNVQLHTWDALYCDTGPHQGETKIEIRATVYLTPEEYKSYKGSRSLQITMRDVPEPERPEFRRSRPGIKGSNY
jgi:hypothetical protein